MLKSIKDKLKQIIGKENLEFLNHSKNYISADFFYNALNFISIPIFTRLLSPADYGIISVFSTVISIMSVFLTLNMASGIKQHYLRHRDTYETALGSNLIFIGIFNVLAVSLLFIFKSWVAKFFVIQSDLFFYAILVSSIGVLNQILLGYFQASQKSKQYAFQQVIINSSILGIAVLIMVLLKDHRYLGRVYAQLIVTLAVAVYSGWMLVKMARFSFQWRYIGYVMSFSIPLIPHTLSGFALAYFDRIQIQQLTNTHKTGLYSFAYNVGMLMYVVVMATSKAWQPIFYKEYANKDYLKIERRVNNFSKYIYFIAVGLILFSREIVMIIADKKYFSALGIVPVIILGYVMVYLYTLFFQYASYRKKTGLISLNTAIAAAVNIGLNYYFIPKLGYQVAAYTTLFSYTLLFGLHFVNSKYILKERVVSLRYLLPNIGWVILAIFVGLLSNQTNFWLGMAVKGAYVIFIGWLFFIKAGNQGTQNGEAVG